MEEHPHTEGPNPEDGSDTPTLAPPPARRHLNPTPGSRITVRGVPFPLGPGDQSRERGSGPGGPPSDGATLTSGNSRPNKSRRATSAHPHKKKLPCPGCDVKFERRSTLRQHMYSHTGEKPFSCDACGSRFSVASNARRHMGTCKVIKQRSAKSLPEPGALNVASRLPARAIGGVAYPGQQEEEFFTSDVEMLPSSHYDFPASTPASPHSPPASGVDTHFAWEAPQSSSFEEHASTRALYRQERDRDWTSGPTSQPCDSQFFDAQSAGGSRSFEPDSRTLPNLEEQAMDALALGLRMIRPYAPGPEGRVMPYHPLQRSDQAESFALAPIPSFSALHAAHSRTDSRMSPSDARLASTNDTWAQGRSRFSAQGSAPQNAETTPGQTGVHPGDPT